MVKTCSIDGCEKPARSGSAQWCKMHYHRWYRHGDPLMTSAGVSVARGRRYRMKAIKGHPLAGAENKVYEHRAALYDKIGDGPHECHWCRTTIEWLPKGQAAAIQVDHINGIGDDNRAENIVPSCASCNTTRAQRHRHDALTKAGWWANNDTQTRTQ